MAESYGVKTRRSGRASSHERPERRQASARLALGDPERPAPHARGYREAERRKDGCWRAYIDFQTQRSVRPAGMLSLLRPASVRVCV